MGFIALAISHMTVSLPQGMIVTWIRPARSSQVDARWIADAAREPLDNDLSNQTSVWVAGEFDLIRDLQTVAARVPRAPQLSCALLEMGCRNEERHE